MPRLGKETLRFASAKDRFDGEVVENDGLHAAWYMTSSNRKQSKKRVMGFKMARVPWDHDPK